MATNGTVPPSPGLSGLVKSMFGRVPRSGTEQLPTDQALGYTSQAADPTKVRPVAGARPFGGSGRANFYGLPQPDELNPRLIGIEGLRRFDDMYRTDADIRRLILMAWSPIVAGTWTLNPFGGDNATAQDEMIAETIWWGLTQHMSPNFFEHLQSAGPLLLRSGFAPFEQIWAQTTHNSKSLLLPRKLDVRLPRSIWRWWQDDYGELTHIGQILVNKPDVVIPATELVYYRIAPEGDNWVGTSLLRQAYKSWYLKDKLERIDAIGQERKAVGVPVVYPPTNSDEETRGQVEAILANLHVNEVGYIVMPGPKQGVGAPEGEGWLVDIVTFDSSSGESIQASLAYHRAGIASSFLGDFMQLGHHQVGARATAEVQEDPFLTAVEALVPDILSPLQRLIDRIVAFNWASANGSPQLQLNLTDTASLSEIATYVQGLVLAGAIQVDPELEDWLRERADLPPANADIRKQKQDAQQAGLKAAASLGPNGEQNDAEPPSPNDPFAKPAPSGTAGSNPPLKAGDSPNALPGAKLEPPKKLDAAPSARWWDQLLSQGQLKQALDGARDSVESAAKRSTMTLAQQMAYQAANGNTMTPGDLAQLAGALQSEYERLYAIGHQTVANEIQKQRQTLKLMSPSDVIGAVGARIGRARQRGEHSASAIANAVTTRLRQATVTGLKNPQQLQDLAEQTALGQLHAEALTNASASLNDGRWDSAQTTPDVVGAFYTAVMDENTCDECEADDTGEMVSLDEAQLLGPPNPECAGGDRCRCMLVYVLADDPSAVAQVVG